MDIHARFSPSQLPRIIRCPGSVQLTKDMPRKSSSYAQEGTMLHKVVEDCLTLNELVLPSTIIKQYGLDEDQKNAVQDILDFVLMLRAEYAPYDYTETVEAKVTLAKFNQGNIICPELEDVWGTLDYSLNIPEIGVLVAVDWKFGSGVEVFPDTEQLITYAIAKLKTAENLLKYNSIRCIIGQPRLYSGDLFKEHTYTPLEALSWLRQTLVPALQEAVSRNPLFHPSDKACMWCAAKNVCEERHKAALQTAQEVFAVHAKLPGQIDKDELSGLMYKFGMLKSYMSDLEDYASAQLQKGLGFPGWKMVAGRSIRQYKDKDETKLVDFLETEGFDTSLCYEDPKFKSVAQLEKVVGRKIAKLEEFQEFIFKPQGKPTLVPESDKREPLNFSTPEEAFSDFVGEFDGITGKDADVIADYES